MVQYYRDLWARCRKMLVPLTSLAIDCGHTKATKANKTENVLGIHQKAFNDINATIAKDVTMEYPHYSLEFEKYTDA
ncbi:hypothetical protein ACHAW6_009463 [Cyclotella cf. meneghiniana]